MERLATEITRAENRKQPLAWQTIQQWENKKSAPNRKRIALVCELLGIDQTTWSFVNPTIETGPAINDNVVAMERIEGRPLSLQDILISLGREMEKLDAPLRAAAAQLVMHICQQPEQAAQTAQRIIAMIGVTGNQEAQRSTSSPAYGRA